MAYIPLRVHTGFSLLESSIRIKEIVEYSKKFEIRSIAISDTHNMFGAMQFSLDLQKNGIKPIIGCCLKVKNGRIWVYCKNEMGYKNLCRVLSKSYIEKAGILEIQDIVELKENLILFNHELTNEEISFISKNIESGIAISRQRMDAEFENRLIKLANELNIPLVAAPIAYYSKQENFLGTDAIRCIKDNTYLLAEDREETPEDAELKAPEEIEKLFSDIPWAIENTCLIAQKCNFMLKQNPPMMPIMQEVDNPNFEMNKRAHQGLQNRLKLDVFPFFEKDKHAEIEAKYQDRLEGELGMISQMGFSGYFLIVSDIVSWAKTNDVPVGPGRGSGASSLTAWCLQITNLDPIRFNLMFERFLNPERVSLPDFDIDFCQERRPKVIDYIQNRYGKDKVAHIITFGSLQYRAAIRDVGRVMQLPYSQVDDLCKKLPAPFQGVAPTISEMREDGRLAEFITPDNEELLKISESIEGLPRHASVHAAGIVIGGKPLCEILPLYKDPHLDMPVIQFAMKQAEQVGLVKFDILGLTALSVLRKTKELLSERGIEIDLDHLPLDDEKTFKMLREGRTQSVFQLDTPGFKRLMLEMQPTCFEDIIAAGALYRPGPMADIPQFVNCKRGFEEIKYMYPEMEPILKDTYGVIVYQEQVLQIAKELAGYSLKEADLLRRAIGKKIKEEMKKHREIFIKNVLKICGDTEEKATMLFDNLARFASYGFPKAHAAPYGLMTFQTAYCKAHHKEAFLCSAMTLENNQEKIGEIIKEARELKIEVLPPCINFSEFEFALQGDKIRYSLHAIKGIGEIAKNIVSERKNGLYKSIEDFKNRMNPNKRVLESLAFGGAFDCFGITRSSAISKIEKPIQDSIMLFDDFEEENHKTIPEMELIQKEFGVLNAIFKSPFENLNLEDFGIYNSLNRINVEGVLFGIYIETKKKKAKTGNIINIISLIDIYGFHNFSVHQNFEGDWCKVAFEIEKSGDRINIKNICNLDNFFKKYKKIVFEIKSEQDLKNIYDAAKNLKKGGTSIYLKQGQESLLIGDYQLDLDFLNQTAKMIKMMV